MKDIDQRIEKLLISIEESRLNQEKKFAEISAKISKTAAQQKITETQLAKTDARLWNLGLNIAMQ